MKNIYEIHIGVPRLDEERTRQVKNALINVGVSEIDYFQRVRDINPITPGCLNGHDLSNPGTMSTVKAFAIDDAIHLVRTGMEKLRELGVEGTNFEIERVLLPNDDSIHHFSLEESLPGFQEVPNAPRFENHLLFNGTASELPSDEQIIALVRSSIGLEINQVVDFTEENKVTPSTVICRVATIYQPSQLVAAKTDTMLQHARERLGNPGIVTEQVLIVGEWKVL